MITLELRKEAAGFSLLERIQLVEELWDDIASTDQEWPLTEGQKAELDRCVADFERNPLRALRGKGRNGRCSGRDES